MSNMEFRKIESIRKYLSEGINNGSLQIERWQKTGEITARKGVIGEEIVTVMSDGLEETRNTVRADENGNPGWVVTNSTGEKYIVKDSVLRKKYEKIEGTEDRYKPVWNPITAVKISESITFAASWGEEQNIASRGYLVFNETFDDIYGIQEKEFEETYECITGSD